ncbi:unnamed protein product [Callosobruchus maculatus]|uniref:Uncharacterized protein n=1 Tax=Callosobruchus maculatus TaxID=64391 RepID=A0A653BK44_CALMS|nr:unnamed protein product [Callosobruchus maculatus]
MRRLYSDRELLIFWFQEVIPRCRPGRSAPNNVHAITQSSPRAPKAKKAAGQPQQLEQISPVNGSAIMLPNTEPDHNNRNHSSFALHAYISECND